ncbi:MAG TPA: curli assembly protein CsgF [Rhizomicrobium sp.]|nr:curli assembly protein CsgF [Rhizomicrobium sp.]
MRRSAWIGAAVVLFATSANASQLVYTPVNPTFGGSPFNGAYLLSTADSNNFDFQSNPKAAQELNSLTSQQNTAQELRQALISALISQASQTVIDSILGTNGQAQDSGTFSLAGETITFNRAGGEINITLTDPTGGQTQITIPVPTV